MESKCVTIKQEPVEVTEESEYGDIKPIHGKNGPEFVEIKIEVDVPVTSAPATSEWESRAEDTEQHESFLEITIKPENDYLEKQINNDVIPTFKESTTSTGNFIMPSAARIFTYTCPVCNKTFANHSNVKRHMLLHTKASVECSICHAVFMGQMKLDKHVFLKHTASGSRNYKCDSCDKKFKSSSNLMQHKKTHLQNKPYECPLCFKTFSFKNNLAKHQGKSRCKLPNTQPLTCNVCEKVFEKEYLLKSHLRRHDTEKPFTCEQCNMKFKYKTTLARHMQLHEGVRPYQCSMCDKSFTHLGLLKPHMRVHTGEKPYICPICSKNFTHKHNMERHKVRHNKIKHLVCELCNKKFPKESRLKYHMKTHVNEKYFACHVCPKRFSHKQNVMRHYSRKHPGETYNCSDTDASVALKVWDTFKTQYGEEEPEIILG